MSRWPQFFAILIAALIACPAHAHHAATASFIRSESVEIEGYIKEFRFINPHVTIVLMVTDDKGAVREWVATAPAVAGFRRWGWTRNMLEEGMCL